MPFEQRSCFVCLLFASWQWTIQIASGNSELEAAASATLNADGAVKIVKATRTSSRSSSATGSKSVVSTSGAHQFAGAPPIGVALAADGAAPADGSSSAIVPAFVDLGNLVGPTSTTEKEGFLQVSAYHQGVWFDGAEQGTLTLQVEKNAQNQLVFRSLGGEEFATVLRCIILPATYMIW